MKKLKPDSNYFLLVGDNNHFNAEHQFFNLTCLFTIVGFSFFIFINIIFAVDFMLTLIKIFVVLASSILYYYSRHSRVKDNFQWFSVLYFLMILFSLLFIGVLNGGVTGGIAPIYTSILALMLFITSGIKRTVLLTIWTLSISSLFILEYYKPSLIVPYSNIQQKYMDLFLSYFSGIIIVAFVVVNVKKMYKKNQLTIVELIETHNSSGAELQKRINDKMKLLTPREREVCNFLKEGKSNKEIAQACYIEVGTVKAHLNKIYKKLETSNRRGTINLISEL